MNPTERVELIRERLTLALSPSFLDISDDSQKHVGHPGAQGGGHYTVNITSDAFMNKSSLESHRMIYAALGDAMTFIHALSIKILR